MAAVIALAALVAVGVGVLKYLSGLADSGPRESDVKVTVEVLPDGSKLGQANHFLMPFGAALPAPQYPAYCAETQTELARNGVTIGAFVIINLQNTYGGDSASTIQVRALRAEVVDEKPARPGAIIQCVNSGGDTPVVARLRAEDGAVAGEVVPPGDLAFWKFSDPSQGGASTSFDLTAGEQQQVNLTLLPGPLDRDVILYADLIANGREFSVALTETPITVPTDAAAAPIPITIKGVFDETAAHYTCRFDLCGEDAVYTRAELDAAIAARSGSTD